MSASTRAFGVGLLAIACFNAWIVVDAGTKVSNGQTDFIIKKWKCFFAKLDADCDGIITQKDFHMRVDCYIEKAHMSEEEATRIHETELSKAWTEIGFDTVGEGVPINEETVVALFVKLMKDPAFEDGLRRLFAVACDIITSFTNKSITFDDYSNMLICIGSDLTVARKAFDKIDTDKDGVLSAEEFNRAGMDFMTGEDKNGPGTLFLGKLNK